jgi:hypothetical protein
MRLVSTCVWICWEQKAPVEATVGEKLKHLYGRYMWAHGRGCVSDIERELVVRAIERDHGSLQG